MKGDPIVEPMGCETILRFGRFEPEYCEQEAYEQAADGTWQCPEHLWDYRYAGGA